MIKSRHVGLFALLALFACKEQDELPFEPIEKVNKEAQVDAHRIRVLNEKVLLQVAGDFKGSAASNNFADFASESSPAYDCDEEITGNASGNQRVNNKDIVCLVPGASFNGTLELRGGTFVVNGSATLTGINGNKGTIVVTETGSLNMQNISLNNNFELVNYGSILNVNAITLSGDFENHGLVSANSFTVNGGADFENTGELIVQNNLMNNNDIENKGKIDVRGDLTINGGAKIKNECQLIVAGNLQNNKDLENKSYVSVGGTLTINGGGKVKFDENAYLVTQHLIANGTLEGPSRNYARIDIDDRTVINWGARATKNLDINDENGFETNNGRFDNSVTIDQKYTITPTECNPGAFVPLITPEYTLVADVAVPELNNNLLSATDVVFENNLAIVSYHLNGAAFGGAVDVLNLASVNSPAFTMNYLNELREFNAVAIDGANLYMAGQRNIDESDYKANDTKGAILYSTLLTNNIFDTATNWTETPMPSFSGNAVEVLSNGDLMFASGATGGGFFKVSAQDGTIMESSQSALAKYVAVSDGVEARLVGSDTEARLILIKNGVTSEVMLGAATNPVDGKNVVVVDNGKAYATLGQNGLVVVDINTEQVVTRYNPEMPGLTNGVAVDDDFVYLANGQSGLLLLRKDSLEFYAQYKYDGSANLVEVVGTVVLIANGTGGVKLLIRDI